MAQSIQFLHEAITEALKQHRISLHLHPPYATFSKSLCRRAPEPSGLWLNRYHDGWDALESVGLNVDNIPLPFLLRWSAHAGYEEPKRGEAPLPPHKF